jgi:hypothetical protein
MKVESYEQSRPSMMPGDVIAFGGRGSFSELIKFTTRSAVSHVGVILQTKVTSDTTSRYFNQIIESTGDGVQIYRASERIRKYDGDVWWLPRRREGAFDLKMFYDFLFSKQGFEYDFSQAAKSAVDILDNSPLGRATTYNREDFEKFFCSELVAAGLEAAGLVRNINASEVTPIDLCRWRIYEPDYVYLWGPGDPVPITRYNTADPAGWN